MRRGDEQPERLAERDDAHRAPGVRPEARRPRALRPATASSPAVTRAGAAIHEPLAANTAGCAEVVGEVRGAHAAAGHEAHLREDRRERVDQCRGRRRRRRGRASAGRRPRRRPRCTSLGVMHPRQHGNARGQRSLDDLLVETRRDDERAHRRRARAAAARGRARCRRRRARRRARRSRSIAAMPNAFRSATSSTGRPPATRPSASASAAPGVVDGRERDDPARDVERHRAIHPPSTGRVMPVT